MKVVAKANIGDRVGAVCEADDETVYFFGYGTYNGEQVIDQSLGVRFLGMTPPEGHENHEIILDNGDKIYGCECWWMSEERMKSFIGDRKVVHEDIKLVRAKK